MGIKMTDMKLVLAQMNCDDCNIEMEWRGQHPTEKRKYSYICKKCGRVQYSDEVYPTYIAVPVNDKPVIVRVE